MSRYFNFLASIFVLFVIVLISYSVSCSKEREQNFFPPPQNNDEVNMDSDYSATIDKEIQQEISEYLLGINLIYPYEKDVIWQDSKVVNNIRNMKTSIIRYPGGTVTSFYHWNALSGNGWEDSWDPKNNSPNQPGTEFMDVDEYMNLIRNLGATPLMGINISSGRRWNRQEDGINEAVALMNYCKEKKFNVKYWYLDNEPYQDDSNGGAKTIEEYAQLINAYASRMKEVDPDIQLIANWTANPKGKRNEYKKLFEIAGQHISYIDMHNYWSYSGPTMDEWLANTPMKRWTNHTFIEEIDYVRQMFKDFGYPDTKFAYLEWNVGPIANNALNSHQCALIQSEMLIEYILGGLDMSTFWPLQWPSKNNTIRALMDPGNKNFNQNYNLFRFFGEVQGNKLLKTKVEKSVDKTIFLAALNQKEDELRIAFLNKNNNALDIKFISTLFENMIFFKGDKYELINSGESSSFKQLARPLHHDNAIKITSPGLSLLMLTFIKK